MLREHIALWDEKSFQRKIKKQIRSQNLLFLLKTPFCLQKFLLKECEDEGFLVQKKTDFGIYLESKLLPIYDFLLKTRFTSQVYCIVKTFQAKSTEELFRKTSNISWDLWINPNYELKVSAHVRRSRIQHEGDVAKTVYQSIHKLFDEKGYSIVSCVQEDSALVQHLDVFVHENCVELRLDFIGQHLHKRGYRRLHSGAPIRETLAAGIFAWYSSLAPAPEVFFDPMCGSGTLLTEGWAFYHHVSPSMHLNPIHTHSPFFQEASWQHAQKKVQQAWDDALETTTIRVYGSDADKRSIEIAKENCTQLSLLPHIRYDVKDFFKDHLEHDFSRKLLISNLPYGKRKSQKDNFLKLFVETCQLYYASWDKVFVYPLSNATPWMKTLPQFRFTHGGIEVAAFYWKAT